MAKINYCMCKLLTTKVHKSQQILRLNAPSRISAMALPQSPDPVDTAPDSLAGFKGPILLREGKRGEGRERERRKCKVSPPTFE